jgi:hypothetical protein
LARPGTPGGSAASSAARFVPTTPTRARRPFDASVDHTDARKATVRRFGRSHRRAQGDRPTLRSIRRERGRLRATHHLLDQHETAGGELHTTAARTVASPVERAHCLDVAPHTGRPGRGGSLADGRGRRGRRPTPARRFARAGPGRAIRLLTERTGRPVWPGPSTGAGSRAGRGAP